MGTAVLGKRSQALDFGPVYELFSTVLKYRNNVPA